MSFDPNAFGHAANFKAQQRTRRELEKQNKLIRDSKPKAKKGVSGPCVSCDQIISFKAQTCIHCGEPDAGEAAKIRAEESKREKQREAEERKERLAAYAIESKEDFRQNILIAVGCVAMVLVMYYIIYPYIFKPLWGYAASLVSGDSEERQEQVVEQEGESLRGGAEERLRQLGIERNERKAEQDAENLRNQLRIDQENFERSLPKCSRCGKKIAGWDSLSQRIGRHYLGCPENPPPPAPPPSPPETPSIWVSGIKSIGNKLEAHIKVDRHDVITVKESDSIWGFKVVSINPDRGYVLLEFQGTERRYYIDNP